MRRRISMHISRQAFSLVELLCVIAIVAILIAMFWPAIQSVRESARNVSCCNNLRQISLAGQNFESAHDRLPPGTLGFDRTLAVPSDISVDQWENDESHQYFWKRTQNTSCLALLLPFVEQSGIYESINKNAFAFTRIQPWPGDESSVRKAMQVLIGTFNCPSDLDGNTLDAVVVTTQPSGTHRSNILEEDGFLIMVLDDKWIAGETFYGSNYAGCSGAHSGGYYLEPALNGFEGTMTCRTRVSTDSILDGSSNTITFGETVGEIVGGDRLGGSSWLFGGLIRGRGKVEWNRVQSIDGQSFFIGDRVDSSAVGFGAMHPSIINTAFADGSVRSHSRGIDLYTWYALCGRADGAIVESQ